MWQAPDLKELGRRLRYIDKGVLALVAQRMGLVKQIEEIKRQEGQPIYRSDIEGQRLDQAAQWAQGYGVNPDFARALLYMIIGESCKTQMIQLQQDHSEHTPVDEYEYRERLKESSLRLYESIAHNYDDFCLRRFPATQLHYAFEDSHIGAIVDNMDERRLIVDLGCGTGSQSVRYSGSFQTIVGIDVSRNMARVMRARSDPPVHACVSDLEMGIPIKSERASLVVMGMGMASELYTLREMLLEVHRILAHGAFAFLSFYNADALLHQWDFVPWPVGLASQINRGRRCVDVRWEEDHIHHTYARAYTLEEIEDVMPRGLPVVKSYTHPTVSSIFPDTLLEDQGVLASVKLIDTHLEGENTGAYLTVLAHKS